MIMVEGELQTWQYVDKNGSTQNVVELVVSSAHFTGEKKEQAAAAAPPTSAPTQNNADFADTEIDDDYPF